MLVKARFKYDNNLYDVTRSYSDELDELSIRFMILAGNDSCDCNRSDWIAESYPSFPELDCGDSIELVELDITDDIEGADDATLCGSG